MQALLRRFFFAIALSALGGCGVPVMVRKRKGDAIGAACGQLRHVARKAAGSGVGAPVTIPAGALPAAGEEE